MSVVRWRKSSYSNMDGGNCVEVADGVAGVVPVRDSKRPGPVVVVSAGAWRAFVQGVGLNP
ncbi:DUF397 domain-containing protein [Streptomyces johnsoniae]|uniref:DUF397 domain-containing protein n=1 Tax=Streptomyces johnsoniae TaxID=3075532 RepID=A0ABU2SCA6_9ACTN|nr:DUF397 domain-containing protein [Streptomyces sp. DSM 41886]MDT0446604.1 DUF397 domain-containing protein [Streptomyces sp. DSM 41886]